MLIFNDLKVTLAKIKANFSLSLGHYKAKLLQSLTLINYFQAIRARQKQCNFFPTTVIRLVFSLIAFFGFRDCFFDAGSRDDADDADDGDVVDDGNYDNLCRLRQLLEAGLRDSVHPVDGLLHDPDLHPIQVLLVSKKPIYNWPYYMEEEEGGGAGRWKR